MSDPDAALFITQEELAERLGVSRGSIIAGIGRGEIQGVRRLGSRVLISWPRYQLEAIGLSDPAALGAFCKSLGVRDLKTATAFYEATRVTPPAEQEPRHRQP